MTKTAKEIQSDFVAMLKASSLATAVNGEVYRHGYRPRDSRKEDIDVIITSATAQQMQEGVVTVHIYVPDVDPYGNGVLVEDGERTAQLERLCQDWLDTHPERDTPYVCYIYDAVSTIEFADIQQHAVVMQIRFKYID